MCVCVIEKERDLIVALCPAQCSLINSMPSPSRAWKGRRRKGGRNKCRVEIKMMERVKVNRGRERKRKGGIKWENQTLHVWSCLLPCIPGEATSSKQWPQPPLHCWLGLVCQHWGRLKFAAGPALVTGGSGKDRGSTLQNAARRQSAWEVDIFVKSSCVERCLQNFPERERKKERELFQRWNSWLPWSSGYSWSTLPSLHPHSLPLSLSAGPPSLPPVLP